MVTAHVMRAIEALKEATFEAGGPDPDCCAFEITLDAATFDAVAREAILSGPRALKYPPAEMAIDGVKVRRKASFDQTSRHILNRAPGERREWSNDRQPTFDIDRVSDWMLKELDRAGGYVDFNTGRVVAKKGA